MTTFCSSSDSTEAGDNGAIGGDILHKIDSTPSSHHGALFLYPTKLLEVCGREYLIRSPPSIKNLLLQTRKLKPYIFSRTIRLRHRAASIEDGVVFFCKHTCRVILQVAAQIPGDLEAKPMVKRWTRTASIPSIVWSAHGWRDSDLAKAL